MKQKAAKVKEKMEEGMPLTYRLIEVHNDTNTYVTRPNPYYAIEEGVNGSFGIISWSWVQAFNTLKEAQVFFKVIANKQPYKVKVLDQVEVKVRPA